MEDYAKIIKEILEKEPTLTATGINSSTPYEEDPIPEEELNLCLYWLGTRWRTKHINPRVSSDVLKRDAEVFAEEITGTHKYISNGAVIAALIYCNITIQKIPDSPNVLTAIKEKKRNE